MRRERVGARGLGHDDHRGGRVRHAGRRHAHRRSPRRGRRRAHRAARRRTRPSMAASARPGARRRRAARPPRRPARVEHAAPTSPGKRRRSARSRCSPPRRMRRRAAPVTHRRAERPPPVTGARSHAGGDGTRRRTRPRALGYALLARARVRPAAADRAGRGRRRHEAVPLPRPGPAARPRAVDVGPEHRARHGHPPEHRLPVPDGPVLLGLRPARRARLGRAAALARLDPASFAGARRPLPAAHARTRAAPASVVAALVYMLTPYVARLRGADLGDPAAVGRAAVDDRAHRRARCATAGGGTPRSSRSSCSSSGSVNATALVLRGHRRRCCGSCTRCWVAREVRLAARAAHVRRGSRVLTIAARRCGGSSGLAVAGRVRARRPAVHRDGRGGRADVDAERGPARPRLLVLLRRRPARAVDRVERSTTRSTLAASSPGYAIPVAGAAGGRVRALAAPRLLRRAGRSSAWSIAVGAYPVRRPVALRRASFKAFARGLDRRASRCAAPGAPCRWSCSALAVLLGVGVNARSRAARRARPSRIGGIGVRGARRCARDRQPAGALERRRSTARTSSGPRRSRSYWERGDRRARRGGRTTRGSSSCRARLRVVPLGRHRRPDHAGAHGPPVRRARADPVRLAGVGRTCSTRSTGASRTARSTATRSRPSPGS